MANVRARLDTPLGPKSGSKWIKIAASKYARFDAPFPSLFRSILDAVFASKRQHRGFENRHFARDIPQKWRLCRKMASKRGASKLDQKMTSFLKHFGCQFGTQKIRFSYIDFQHFFHFSRSIPRKLTSWSLSSFLRFN